MSSSESGRILAAKVAVRAGVPCHDGRKHLKVRQVAKILFCFPGRCVQVASICRICVASGQAVNHLTTVIAPQKQQYLVVGPTEGKGYQVRRILPNRK